MRQHFHCRSWDGHIWLYFYLGPLRLTIFNSAWFFGKRKKRSLSEWALHYLGRGIIITAFLGLPAWATYQHPYWPIDLLTSVARRIK